MSSLVWEVWQGPTLVCSCHMQLSESQARNKVANEARQGIVMEAKPVRSPRSKHSTLPERLDWLRAHPEVRKLPKQEIFKRMRDAGLFAPSSYWMDCHIDRLLELL